MSFIVHPSQWEIEHAGAIFSGQAYQAAHDGQLPDTPMWRMLEFRHSLNAARFSHWHPNVALILENREPAAESPQYSLPRVHGWIGHMRGPALPVQSFTPEQLASTPLTPDVADWRAITQTPPQVQTQAVPEPSAALQGLTALAFTLAVFVKRHRLRRLMSRGGRGR